MTDPLSPEDRALYDAFFKAYGAKHAELKAAAAPGAEISLDVCTVHAIKAMTDAEIERRYLEIIPPNDSSPRIVSAVGVGVRVKRDDEPPRIAVEVVGAKADPTKLSAEGRELLRAARQTFGVCEWWTEAPSPVGQLRRFKSSTCGAPEWRSDDHGYREMTFDKWIEELGRCKCGGVVVIRGEDELEEGGA